MRRSRDEAEEDAYIAYLESKLGYRKGGKRNKLNVGDGLDELFDLAESFGPADGGPCEEEENSGPTDSDGEYEEWGGVESEYPSPQVASSSTPVTTDASPTKGKYIPPHLRNAPAPVEDQPSEAQLRLQKQLKGLLNRVSEQNVISILDTIEGIYRDHRRNDVTRTITDFIIRGITDHSSLLDSFVVLYATLVSALHKIIGIEFAAYFVQDTVTSYEKHYATASTQLSHPPSPDAQKPEEEVGKECQNLIILISELYNFQVISCVLVYDLIRVLLSQDVTELNVELLLKILRSSGQQLRHDDPSALKDIIDIVQNKLSAKGETLSSRAQFMIETLTNLKNNKLKRNATQNQGGDAVERMKKLLSGLSKKRHVLAHESLRVSLDDLHSAENKGKWWLVGAAWRGDPLVDQQKEPKPVDNQADSMSESALMKLARQQGMNTDIRRSIFVVLMSSEDYVDACERLSQLNLSEVQQREIVRVLLHCCGNEKSYNPYYTLVGQQLCRVSHSHKITIQFCLWDFLRDLGETTVGGAEVIKNAGAREDFGTSDGTKIATSRLKNVAKAFGWWIAKDSVGLAILKPVDFTILKPPARVFLKELFTQVFIFSQTSKPLLAEGTKNLHTTRNRGSLEEIFPKGSRNETLAMGVVYFLSEAFRKQSKGGRESKVDEFTLWATGVARETLRTGVDVVLDLKQ
ncbi:ARM repeat-containing protein [Pleurotus eryngii]|uniref:ARM repeat-containing protein n=1 Tax=Pleurotus eryngii TaxID=5323 RepID=A0A9P6D480_PLEER|nr:ARM repeat-containing protein [Pleurotus eryngii]